MNDLFIQGLTIDWNRVRPYNYVRQIPAISGIDTFTFHKPITFFVGENGSGKSTLLEAIAVAYGFNAEGGTKNYFIFPHTTPIRNYVRHDDFQGVSQTKVRVFFSGQRASTM